jgi:pSer/pThr/pTyr-binding forkhead associated (FHA) protein
MFKILDGGTIELEDLGSLNGTFVNGRKVAGTVTLAHGDLVKLGTSTFEFEAAPVRSAPTMITPTPKVQAPSQPFGSFAPGKVAGRSRGKVASRQLLPELISIFAVVGTAIALVLYFALR